VYLYLRVKDPAGYWADRRTDLEDTPANRETAEKLLRGVRDKLHAQEAALGVGAREDSLKSDLPPRAVASGSVRGG
jgi:hypothetical protein